MANIRGAEALIKCLIHEGVDTVFGYPGGCIMPTYDALYDYRDQLRHVLVRHEQGATHAAEGYARITGRVGVCFATSGPGATNLVTGIADAMLDSIPMVCITGQVNSWALGTDAFQETDVVGVTIPITKWNYQITSPDEIPQILPKAFAIARSGRPGPVVIDITKDAQTGKLDYNGPVAADLPWYSIPTCSPEAGAIAKAAQLLNAAQRPYALVGHGVLIAQAQDVLLKFIEKSGIPVGLTLHGLSSFPTDHPLCTGMLGMHGHFGPNKLTNEADVILAVGMRFDDRVTGDVKRYAPDAKIIHIEVDPSEINKVKAVAVAINADAKDALSQLLPLVEKVDRKSWIERFSMYAREEQQYVISSAVSPQEGPLKMSEVVHRLSELTDGRAVVVADVGQHQMMAARYYKFKEADSWITSGGLGTMGFALPAALGTQVGTDRLVVAIIGDGGYQMTFQELGTIAQENLPVKVMVLNNSFLGMVRQWQELFFDNRYSSVHLANPDFVKLADAFGINASRVSERENLTAAIETMVNSEGPYVLEVVVENEQNVFPMVPAGAAVSEVRLK